MKLSHRRENARRAMLVHSCNVSRAMGVIKVSNNKGDLQGHSRALAMVPSDRPHTISYQSYIATMSVSCNVSEILSNRIKFISINSVHNITMSSHCLWLDRLAITSHLCLPMTTKPKNKKKQIILFILDSQHLGIIQKHSKVF